jgi:hypothetical protein
MYLRLVTGIIASALLVSLPLVSAFAQELGQGARVRGHAVGGRFSGQVAWVTGDSLAVVQQGDTVVHAQNDIRTLDLASGSKRHPWTGAAIGGGAGALAGIALIISADDDRDSELEGLEVTAAGALLLGGTAIGALTGALIKSPRWTRVRPSGVGVSISF